MADKTISDLTAATSLSLSDLFEIENAGGNSRKATLQQFVDFGLPVLIERFAFAGTASDHSFTIPSGLNNLRLIIVARSAIVATGGNVSVQFNGDTGNNYSRQVQSMVNTTTSGACAVSQSSMASMGVPGSTAPSGAFGRADFIIPDYAGTTHHKRMGGLAAYRTSDLVAGQGMEQSENEWRDTSAITSLRVFETAGNNLVNGSFAAVYGFK